MWFVWQDFQDILQKKTCYDNYKCHDVRVLHWLVNLGYKCLMTVMRVAVKGSFITYQGLPPIERMSLEGPIVGSSICGQAIIPSW